MGWAQNYHIARNFFSFGSLAIWDKITKLLTHYTVYLEAL